MTSKQVVLALDFDGVVWDSVGESYFVARRAWAELFGPLPDDLQSAFRAGRWLVRTGHDFYALLALLKDNPDADLPHYPKDAFKAFLAQHVEESNRFDQAFYRIRDEEREGNPDHWVSLQPPFPDFMEAFPTLREEFADVIITTTKDEASVHFLLGRAGINLRVLGKEFSRDKNVQVSRLAESHGIDTDQVLLMDDLVDNLLAVRSVGARVALATWGYNTVGEQQEASALKIPLVRAQHIVDDLKIACL